MMKNLKISERIILFYFIITALTVTLVSILFYFTFKNTLINRTLNQLSSVNMLKKTHIETFFSQKQYQNQIFFDQPYVRKLTHDFFNNNTSDTTQFLSTFAHILNEDSHRCVMIINTYRNILYSSGNWGKFTQLTLTDIKKKILEESAIHNGVFYLDLSEAESSKSVNILAVYPIKRVSGESKGFLVFAQAFEQIEQLIYERTGMGNTGESYIVGKDLYMRSRSRFFSNIPPVNLKVDTEGVNTAFKNKSGESIIKDYRNVPVLSAHRTLEIPGLEWVILSEIDFKEAMMPIVGIRDNIIFLGLFISLIVVLISVKISNRISYPIVQLNIIINELAKGRVPQMNVTTDYDDEIKEMIDATSTLIDGLNQNIRFAKEIGDANYSSSYTPLSYEDVLGHALLQMRDKLVYAKELDEKRGLERSAGLLEGQEKERRRISRELHDGIGQLLSTARFLIGNIETQEELKNDLKKIIDDTISEVRKISNNLMPSVLIDFGVESALALLCEQTSKLTNIKVNFDHYNENQFKIPFELSVNLYRIAQEALNNMIKYANADKALINVEVSNNLLIMEIKDNGNGFDLEHYLNDQKKRSSGLKNMRERVTLMGGIFNIETSEEGTSLSIEIPLKNTQNKKD